MGVRSLREGQVQLKSNGDAAQEQSLAEELVPHFPHDTFVQFVALATI